MDFLDYPERCLYDNETYTFGTHDLEGECSQISCYTDYSLAIYT